jgi:antitoxin StbD
LIQDAHGKPIAILNHNTAAAYLVPVETYELLMELVDEKELEKVIMQRLSKPFTSIKVDIDEL